MYRRCVGKRRRDSIEKVKVLTGYYNHITHLSSLLYRSRCGNQDCSEKQEVSSSQFNSITVDFPCAARGKRAIEMLNDFNTRAHGTRETQGCCCAHIWGSSWEQLIFDLPYLDIPAGSWRICPELTKDPAESGGKQFWGKPLYTD